MTGWLGSSMVECSHGQRKTFASTPIEPQYFTGYITLSDRTSISDKVLSMFPMVATKLTFLCFVKVTLCWFCKIMLMKISCV